MKTSYRYNRLPEGFLGIKWISIYGGLLALVVSSIISHVYREETRLAGILVVVSTLGVPAIIQWLTGTNYDFEVLEQILARLYSLVLPKKETSFERSLSVKNNRLFGLDGVEIRGFRLVLGDDIGDDSIESFHSRMDHMVRNLPVTFRMRVFRKSLAVEGYGEKSKKLRKNDTFVFFDLWPNKSGYRSFEKILNYLPREEFIELSPYETEQAIENLFSNNQDISIGSSIFKSPVAILREKALVHLSDMSTRAMGLSLASLPKKIDGRFQRFYDILNHAEGFVCVAFESLSNDFFISTAKENIIRKSLKNFDREELDIDQDSRVRLRMHITSLLQGNENDLKMIESNLANVCHSFDEDYRPVFARDNAFLERLVKSTLPGHVFDIPYRKKLVLNKREASLFLPMPLRSGDRQSPVRLRTEANSDFGWDVDTGHPTLVLAKVESGKSTLLGHVVSSHIGKQGEVASFTIEVGASFEFLSESLSDVNLFLERDQTGSLVPLEDDPLRILLSFGDNGKSQARDWICDLIGIDESHPRLQNLVVKALDDLVHDEQYDLNYFYEMFKGYVGDAYSGADESHSSQKALFCLSKYVGDGIYANFFNPDAPKKSDYSETKHFYIRQSSASRESDDLAQPFFNFALRLLTLVRHDFEPNGSRPHNTLVVIDEIHFLLGYISRSYWIDLNKQARKQNIGVIAAMQNITDVVDQLGEYATAFLGSFSRFCFYHGISDISLFVKALGKQGRDEEIEAQFSECSRRIEKYRAPSDPSEKQYSWGFVNEFGEFSILFLDLNPDEVWQIDTRPAAKYIRSQITRKTGLSFFESCQRLAEKGPKRFHKSKIPSREDIDRICHEVIYG